MGRVYVLYKKLITFIVHTRLVNSSCVYVYIKKIPYRQIGISLAEILTKLLETRYLWVTTNEGHSTGLQNVIRMCAHHLR